MTMHRFLMFGIRMIAVCFGFGVTGWCALQWQGSFQGDEAIYGIMARDIISGARPLYIYGISYGGSLITYLAAPFVWISGYTVPGLRAIAVLLFAVLLILQGYVVEKRYGTAAATIATLFAGVPAINILVYVFEPMPGVDLYACISTTMLLIFLYVRPKALYLNRLRWMLIGALSGFAIWLLPLNFFYAIAVVFLAVLRSTEWKRMRSFFNKIFTPFLSEPGKIIINIAFTISGALIIANYAYQNKWTEIRYVLAIPLILLSLFSIRIMRTLNDISCYIIGFIIGYSPFILGNLYGIRGIVSPLRLIMPSPHSLIDLGVEIVPNIVGISLIKFVPEYFWYWQTAPVLGMCLIVSVVLVTFLWRERLAVLDLILLRASPDERLLPALLLILLFVPLAPMLGMQVINVGMVRYVIPAWQAFAMILGIQGGLLLKKHKYVFLLCLAIWFGNMYYSLSFAVHTWWMHPLVMFRDENVQVLEEYLYEKETYAGYSDYWLAHPLTYLTKGRLLIATNNFSTGDKIAEQTAETSKRFALIFHPQMNPPDPSVDSVEKLEIYFGNRNNPDPILTARLPQARLIERKRVDDWDVWILEAPVLLHTN